jgi:hypothetical protein
MKNNNLPEPAELIPQTTGKMRRPTEREMEIVLSVTAMFLPPEKYDAWLMDINAALSLFPAANA